MKLTTTLQNYRDAIKKKLHIPVGQDNGEWSDEYIMDAINESRRAFWEKARYRAKYGVAYFDTAVGVAEYDLTAKSIEDIDFVRYYNGTRRVILDFMPLESYLAATETAQSGEPRGWTIFDNELKLYPTPPAVVVHGIEVWGTKELTNLEADGDVDGDIEDRYMPLIVRYALGLCWDEAEQHDEANRHYTIFEKRFDEAAFAINSMTMGQNTPGAGRRPRRDNELSERRFNTPIG